MKVLITGGAGYIGSTIYSALTDAGHHPVILDSFVVGPREFVKGRIYYEGDIADHGLLAKIKKEHPDLEACVHCAARIIVPESVANPYLYYTENVVKSISLFHSLHTLGIEKIIFSSSASLYKTPDKDFMVTEESPLNPLSPYARTKQCMEMALEDFCSGGCFRGVSLRYFNPIGAEKKMRTGPFIQDDSHILPKLVDVALGNAPVFYITGTNWPTRDGSGIRDYMHVWDLARAHVLAVENFDGLFTDNNYNVLNLGSGRGVTVKEMVRAFMDVHGKIDVEYAEPRPGDVAGAYTSCDKAYRLLGWKVRYGIEEGIKDALEWLIKRKEILGY